MTRNEVSNEYFEWLFKSVCEDRFPSNKENSFRKLLEQLHDTEFIFIIPKDENRAEDGISLRDHYIYDYKLPLNTLDYLDGPCSVLEMMVALAERCEEFMDDPLIGDRTGQWFWGMITNLGLGSMVDSRYDELFVDDVITRFLNREYEPDGRGGLFTIKYCDYDLRDVEIWYQLCWFLNEKYDY